jgi:hypothetical protein
MSLSIRLRFVLVSMCNQREVGQHLTPEEDMVLLSLCVKIPNRPNLDYCRELLACNDTVISSSFVSDYLLRLGH